MRNTVSLKKNSDFRRLYYRGGSVVSDCLVIYYKRNRDKESRLGITVSKKVGNAVVRNRVRRLIKESYRLNEDGIKQGFDVVVVARSSAKGASFRKISSALMYLIRKSGLTA